MKNKQQASLHHKLSEIYNSLLEKDKKAPKISPILEELIVKFPQYSRLPKNIITAQISRFLSPGNHMNKSLPFLNPETELLQSNPKPDLQKPTLKRQKDPSSIDNDIKSSLSQRNAQNKLLESSPSLDQLGGLSNILPQVLQLIYLPLKYKHLFNSLNLNPPRGILLTGPPGSGKTALALAIGKHIKETLGFSFLFNSGTELIAGVSGESEQNIRGLFQEAANSTPCLIFIDEIDSIAGKKEQASKDMERRVVSQLLSCLDSLPKEVFVIAACSRPETLDPGLRRSGRFDREILLQVPDEALREDILNALTKKIPMDKEMISMKTLAKATPGYVPADLDALIREAGLQAVDRISKDLELCERNSKENIQKNENNEKNLNQEKQENNEEIANEDKILEEILLKTQPIGLISEDFTQALLTIQPTAKREGFAVVPDVTWEDIGALSELKNELEKSLILPIQHLDKFKKFHISAPVGILLYGPPGCGKTLLAKAVANASQANFIAVKGPELLNKYLGESERAVRGLFSRAKASSPCIIFLDEIDALCPKRGNEGGNQASERVVNQFLTELDGVEIRKEVYIIAATNRPDILDPAMLRPGRLDKLLYVPLPNKEERGGILKSLTRKSPLGIGVDVEKIGLDERCEGFTGADLAALVREAGLNAIVEDREALDKECFEKALDRVKPSLSVKDRGGYEFLKENLRGSKNYMG